MPVVLGHLISNPPVRKEMRHLEQILLFLPLWFWFRHCCFCRRRRRSSAYATKRSQGKANSDKGATMEKPHRRNHRHRSFSVTAPEFSLRSCKRRIKNINVGNLFFCPKNYPKLCITYTERDHCLLCSRIRSDEWKIATSEKILDRSIS